MIKKTTLLLACICSVFMSCSTDIEVNTPALQASKEGKLFRASIKKAVINPDGSIDIIGNTATESIRFTTSSTAKGKQKMGLQTINTVSFASDEKRLFSKNESSNGEVIITEIHNNLISGEFRFEDLKDPSGKSISFKNGWFYKIPLENAVAEDTSNTEEINPCLLDASLTAIIDGSEMITDDHKAIIFGVRDVSILIKASNETEEITMVFPIDASPGTYSLSGSGDYSATYSFDKDKASAISGKLTIISHDTDTKCLSGRFEFTTTTGVEVTQGNFEYGY